jgi:hypothetical protein
MVREPLLDTLSRSPTLQLAQNRPGRYGSVFVLRINHTAPQLKQFRVESGRSQSPTGEQQNSGSSAKALPRRPSLRRWRSAEQQVLSLLQGQGWDANDVSRQNVGYDIEVRTPEGQQFFVEVKSIRNPNEPFILTSNEEAVARIKGDAYQLALVRDAGAALEVAFIQNPVSRLDLTRQCRQWVWECSSYEFDPQRFLLE